MTEDTSLWAPTVRIRFVLREDRRILQQWFAPDVPKYMIDARKGEWRDVQLENEA